MEITVGDYGRMIFEMMTGEGCFGNTLPEHWRSISKKAKPLVEELLRLNKEMVADGKPGGYNIVGRVGGRVKLPARERIRLAQKKLWGVRAGRCKIGELVWLIYDHDMIVGQNDPFPVEFKKKEWIGVEVRHMGGSHIDKISVSEMVLRAPKDWVDKEELYATDEYWLKKADELGI